VREGLVLPAALNQVPCSHLLIIVYEAEMKESVNTEAATLLGVSEMGVNRESDAKQSAVCVLQV